MSDPQIDIRRAKDGAVMVFVASDDPVYVYRLGSSPSSPPPKAKYLMRGRLEVHQGGKQ